MDVVIKMQKSEVVNIEEETKKGVKLLLGAIVVFVLLFWFMIWFKAHLG